MKHTQLAVVALGVALMFAAVALDRTLTVSDLRISGAVLALTGVGLALTRRLGRSEDTIYDNGHRDGWAEGYDAGRKLRANVVALPVEKLCNPNAARHGRHAARCRDNCHAEPKKEGGTFDSPGWSEDGAS